ncbi:efflux RND transporter periplasmic adaptor subunit [Glycocaulis profundi]|nr:efflux RND transporter periplasmic adaptor subunit [Glycocaulis profundi]
MTDERKAKLQSLSIEREPEPARSGVPIAAVAVIALLTLGLGAGGGWVLARETAPEPAPPPPPPAAAAPANSNAQAPAANRPAPRASGLVASGYVVARREATVSAEITGRISEVLVEEGMEVDAGEVLARLDDTRARLDLSLAEARLGSGRAQIDALQAQLQEARQVESRAERLAQSNYATEAALTSATAQRQSLAAQLAAARADLAAAQVQVDSQRDYVDRHVVRAPFAGVVIAKNAQVGEILSPVSAGGGFTRTGVATLVDMASLEIEVDVNEGQIGRVSPGQRVEAILDAYADWRIPARVEAIIPTADRSRATIKVRVALDERDGRVLPDMAARVTFLDPGS